MSNEAPTETLTDAMINKLNSEAAAAGDQEMVALCAGALDGDNAARQSCAAAITEARAMDDGTTLVRVVA